MCNDPFFVYPLPAGFQASVDACRFLFWYPCLPLFFLLALCYGSYLRSHPHMLSCSHDIIPISPPITLCLWPCVVVACLGLFVLESGYFGLTFLVWSLGSLNQHLVNVWGNINFDEGTDRRPGVVLKPASAETRKSLCPLDTWWAR